MTQVGSVKSAFWLAVNLKKNEGNRGEDEVHAKLRNEKVKDRGEQKEKREGEHERERERRKKVSWRNKEECPQYYEGDN